jgi:DNA-binding transcriptional LysR family regulator
MDTRFLSTFVTVVDCGSFAEAARRLHLTPAGLAQRIRTLETEIGARAEKRHHAPGAGCERSCERLYPLRSIGETD